MAVFSSSGGSSNKTSMSSLFTARESIETFQNKPNLKFDINTSEVQQLVQSVGIYDRSTLSWHNRYNRLGILDPYNTKSVTKEYIFITKPDLHLVNTGTGRIANVVSNSVFLQDAIDRYPHLVENLQSSYQPKGSNRGPFMALLSNTIQNGIDLPDMEADSIETSANVYGTKIMYRGTSMKSDEGHTISMEFEDTKFLEVYMLFKMYDVYEQLKWLGYLEPDPNNSDDTRWINYTLNKVLHDQMTIYKFIVGEDGMSLMYWARITGMYPNSIARSAFSDTSDVGPQRLSIGWGGSGFVRDMDPIILSDFNALVEPYIKNKNDLPLFNIHSKAMEGRWASMPYISAPRNNTTRGKMQRYYLMWKE